MKDSNITIKSTWTFSNNNYTVQLQLLLLLLKQTHRISPV